MTNYLRPDEKATESEIRKSQGRTNAIRTGLETASSIAVAGLASTAASKIAPFLNQYIPEDLAFKGINKVMPAIGKFLKDGMGQGLSLKSGLDYLKSEFSKEEEKNTQENRNIIQKYSPELHQFISENIQQGRSPLEAGALASLERKGQKNFKNIIKKIEEDYKSPWSAILETVYGNKGQSNQKQEQTQQNPQQQSQQQSGPGQSALMNILQQLNQVRGG